MKFTPVKTYWREILAVLMLLLAVVFFRSERAEIGAIIPQIQKANPLWLTAALAVTLMYIFFLAGMYRKCFASIGLLLQWNHAVVLFLKRNFISIFLPAGGVSALAYSPSQIRKAGFNKTQVHQASGLFGFAGLLTVFIAGVPVIIFTIFNRSPFKNAWTGFALLVIIILLLFLAVRSIKNKGWLFSRIDKKFPSFTPTLQELFGANVHIHTFYGAVAYSLGVELCGMLHVYLAMLALGLPFSFGAAASAYIIAVLMMIISPFLRGLGAVELSMVYVLQQFGYTAMQALSITVIYRVFEFWLPLLSGLIAFAWKGRKLFFRLAPALLTFALGIVNIISTVTSPLHERQHLLREYIPLTAIHASNLLVLFIGLFLLVTATFLFRGLRNAWIIAIMLSLFSLIGHLTKALDYEEAIFAGLTFIVLAATVSQYRIRSSSKWMQVGLKTAGLSLAAVLLFGFVSFYFIDIKHFGIDFTWQQSLQHTLRSFLLVEDSSLQPITRFGHEFIWLIRTTGFITWGFLLFTLIRPRRHTQLNAENARTKATFLISQFGNSAADYFKQYKDKHYFFSAIHEAFIAYRVSRGFAIALEGPVCAEENKIEVLKEFDLYCRNLGIKPAFYRVGENSINWFNQLKKQKLIIGQEAILDLQHFSLDGKEKKSLRNGLNSLQKKGYTLSVRSPPHTADLIISLQEVSEEWLKEFDKVELIFSHGMFDEKELQQQDIITLNDAEGVV
ncbi:MAG TPA: phosphatidylglycerol lysyltransferase domain-containing protein, partial [Agriterribacter sp.]|nr:phosphatidylglycerol lysyltransferase domain-containing protein [Agriterribacter sp.]